jgi:hypothetical protein
MKQVILILTILVMGFGIKSYSQTIVTLDSIVERTEANPFVIRTFFIYSDLDDSVSSIIEEKGISLNVINNQAYLFDTVHTQDILTSLLIIEEDSFIYLPIHNETFDTILYFGATDATILLKSYLIIDSDTVYNDSIFEIQLHHVGLEDVYNSNFNCKVYPTIISDYLSIEIDNTPSIIRISDLFGREVYYKDIHNDSKLNLSFLKKGIYFCRVENSNGYKVFKLVKNN